MKDNVFQSKGGDSRMDRLTIRQKLYAVFGALIAIFACMSIYAGYTLHAINNNAMCIATEHLNNVLALSQADRALAIYRQAEYSMRRRSRSRPRARRARAC